MIVTDTGPLVSAINRGEGRRHAFARDLLSRLGRQVIVPWPVLVEVDLLLRSRGSTAAAVRFAESLIAEVHRLHCPTAQELELAVKLGSRYADLGVDLPDVTVMAIAHHRDARILTWDFRHFRAVVMGRGHHWPLLVEEGELPEP